MRKGAGRQWWEFGFRDHVLYLFFFQEILVEVFGRGVVSEGARYRQTLRPAEFYLEISGRGRDRRDDRGANW